MDIESWNIVLAEWFLSEGPHCPVYLSATPTELQRMSDELGLAVTNPAEDLRTAVCRATYSYGVRKHPEWSRSGTDKPPPWLAFLAASVIVVEQQTQAKSTEFYRAFSSFLGLGQRLTQHEYEESFYWWWVSLASWLEKTHEGSRGYPTWRSIPERGPRSVIGHPYTQVLLRREDRRDLDAFLADFSTEYGDLPELTDRLQGGMHLVGALRRWASGRQMLTSRLRSIIDGNSETTIESLAYMLLDRLFDQASENDETSRRRIPIVPVLDELDRELRLAAMAPRSVSLDNPLVLGECTSAMYSPGQPTYLHQLPTDQILQQGIVIDLPRDVTLIAHGRTIHALARREWDLWCGVRSVEGGEQVYLLARTGLDSRLGVPRKRSAVANMPAGWTVYGPVNFTAELERRAGATFMAKERRLVPRLRGGLPLPGHRNYLIGGEPVVELPGLTNGATLDGKEQQVTGEELALRALHLDAGLHVIEAGPFRMAFKIVDVREHPVAVPLLGRTPTGAVVATTEPGADLIRGVQLNSAESQRGEVRLSPVVETVVLLGIPGEVGIIEVTRARWADQLGLPRTAVEMLARSTYPGGDRVVGIPSWLAWSSSDGWTIAHWEHADGPDDDSWLEPADWQRLVDEIGPEPTIFQFERSPHLSAEAVLAEWQHYRVSVISE